MFGAVSLCISHRSTPEGRTEPDWFAPFAIHGIDGHTFGLTSPLLLLVVGSVAMCDGSISSRVALAYRNRINLVDVWLVSTGYKMALREFTAGCWLGPQHDTMVPTYIGRIEV